MKILFSPSEGKKIPQDSLPLTQEKEEIFKNYLNFLDQTPLEEVAKTMGYSKIAEAHKILDLIRKHRSIEAIRLYDGVAYEALDFEGLKQVEQDFLRENLYICSNLFGFVLAKENLPFYKLKQGEGFANFKTKEIYELQKHKMNECLKEEFVLDLRAEFYKKLYHIPCFYYDFEFYKNGKKVSHYAKHYRGIVAKEVAKSGGVEDIQERLSKYGLSLLYSKNQKNCTILAFYIVENC